MKCHRSQVFSGSSSRQTCYVAQLAQSVQLGVYKAKVELSPERPRLALALTLRISRVEKNGRKEQAKRYLSSIQLSTEDGDCSLRETQARRKGGKSCTALLTEVSHEVRVEPNLQPIT